MIHWFWRLDSETSYVDLGAELPFAAEKNGRKIAVEVKTFAGLSAMNELEKALGQFLLYDFLLGRQDPDRALYLAITQTIYRTLFADADGRDLVDSQGLRLITFEIGRLKHSHLLLG